MSKKKQAANKMYDGIAAEAAGLYGFAEAAFDEAAWLFREAGAAKDAAMRHGFEIAVDSARRCAAALEDRA